MRLRIGRRAHRQSLQISAWWGAHRAGAGFSFAEELEGAYRLIGASPGVGVSYPTARSPGVRRLLLARTGHHVYYRVDERSGTIHVLAIWSVQRGRGPRL